MVEDSLPLGKCRIYEIPQRRGIKRDQDVLEQAMDNIYKILTYTYHNSLCPTQLFTKELASGSNQ